MRGPRGARAAQVAYFVGTALLGLLLALGGLVTGDSRLGLVGLLCIVVAVAGIRWRSPL